MSKRVICLWCCLWVLAAAGLARGELVGHWKLDEGGGTKIADSSGKGNDGSVTAGNPTWIAGVQGTALLFHGLGVSGGGGDTITVPHSASLDIGGPISIALWIRRKPMTRRARPPRRPQWPRRSARQAPVGASRSAMAGTAT